MDEIHYSFGCPVVQAHHAESPDSLRFAMRWKNVTCKVCTGLYASWPWRRIARLMLSHEESLIVAESDKRYAKKRFPRWLIALAPAVACMFCPAHVLLLIGFLGGGSMLGIHTAEHHDENWHIFAGIALIVWSGLLFEVYHHRKSCHGHDHHKHVH